MTKKIKWLIACVAAGLLVIAFAIPALATGPDGSDVSAKRPIDCGNCQGLGYGPDQSVATLLGLTQEEIREQRQAGKSLSQIAAAQNISEEVLINAIMARKQETVQNMVTTGTLTQSEADLRLTQMKERVQLAVNRTTVGPPEWAGANSNGQKGKGMRAQIKSQKGPANCIGTGQMMRSARDGR